MEGVRIFLTDHAEGDLLHWRHQAEAAQRFGLPFSVVEEIALELGLLPARYQRNRKAISVSGQLALFRSRVAVVGCGGLGGYVIEELARLGVGRIVAIHPDVFEEHNLNRQLLSTPSTLGKAKVEAASARVSDINPAVTVTPVMKAFCTANVRELFIDLYAFCKVLRNQRPCVRIPHRPPVKTRTQPTGSVFFFAPLGK